MQDTLRIALVHDYWVRLRGGERVFLALSRMFPQADCYTLIAPKRGLPPEMAHIPIRSSFLGRLPGNLKYYRAYLPLYPLAARSLNLANYDLVITSSSGFTHQVITTGVHICYCHTPLRYAWQEFEDTIIRQRDPLTKMLLAGMLRRMRHADRMASRRVTAYIANSTTVQQRIASYYQRQSDVVHPFVDTARFTPQSMSGEYFLVVSHLHRYKHVDLAVQACTRLGVPLLVVGVGPELARLLPMAGPTVRFVGHVTESALPEIYARSKALLQCGEEDFGIAALEAQANGRPVIAFGVGGACETVIDGVTGVHFHEQTPNAVIAGIERFQRIPWHPQTIRAHAEQFDERHFRTNIQRIVNREMQAWQSKRP